ncbi:hypothetical protein Tco_0400980 [Tanacetum coccineum]
MEQHSTRELFKYRKDINETAFVVATLEKIYAHKSLTFNDAVSCEQRLQEKQCMVEIWVIKGLFDEAKGNILGMEIFRSQSGNTLRVSQSRVYNGGDKVDDERAIW